jgi:hypothetical protein
MYSPTEFRTKVRCVRTPFHLSVAGRGFFVIALSLAWFGFAAGVVAQRIEINFDDQLALLNLPARWQPAGLSTFVNSYKEDGMLFTSNVDPPDPKGVGAHPEMDIDHYHLVYRNPDVVNELGRYYKIFFGGLVRIPLPLWPPQVEPRVLEPMFPGHVIQMVYDPNNDGMPDPFKLISIVVSKGRINVGTKSPRGIEVYNNLTGGFEWFLIDANNLTRATIEWPRRFAADHFTVDKIVFEPSSSLGAATHTPALARTSGRAEGQPLGSGIVHSQIHTITNDVRDAVFAEVTALAQPVFAHLDVADAHVDINPDFDRFDVAGTVELGAQSDGVDIPNEDVSVTFGPFRQLITAGGFECEGEEGTCLYNGPFGALRRC